MKLGNYEFEKGMWFSEGPLKGIGINPTDGWHKSSGSIALFARRNEDWRLEGPAGKENPYGINVVEISEDDEWNAHFIPVGTTDLETALASILNRLTKNGLITLQQRTQAYEVFGIEESGPGLETVTMLSRPRAWARSIARRLGL